MTVPSKTYYVSSLHGSADFDGLTPQTPFLHPAQVSALSLQPGDKVLLERGSVFAGEAMHLKNLRRYCRRAHRDRRLRRGRCPALYCGKWYRRVVSGLRHAAGF